MSITHLSTVPLAQSIPVSTRATCMKDVGSYPWLQYYYNNYHIILNWSLLSFNLCFCFVTAYLHCCISASHPECPRLTYLLPPLAMWDVVSIFSLPPSSGISEFACGLHCKSSCCLGTWSLVHHGFCTLWTVSNLSFAGTGYPVL